MLRTLISSLAVRLSTAITLRRVLRYVLVVIFVVLAAFFTTVLFGASGLRASSLLLILAVIFSALTSGWKAGLLATFLCSAISIWALLDTRISTQGITPLQQIRLIVFSLEGIIISLMLHSLARAKYLAEQKSLQLAVSHTNLQDAHHRIEQIFERISDAFVAVDRDWNFTYLNSKAEELLGTSRHELIGANVWKSFRIKKNWMEYRQAVHAMRSQETVTFETYFEPLKKWLAVRYYPSPEGLSVFFEDITEQKNAVASLQLLQEQLGVLAASPVVGILFADFNGGITYANDYFLKMVGFSREELKAGRLRWDELTPDEWTEIDRVAIETALKKGSYPPFEKEYFHKNGTRIPVLIGFAVSGEKRDLAIAFVLDITKSKQLERQKDEFLSVASHELKTPVTSLKSYAQVLQKGFRKRGDSQSAELVQRMEKQINRLTGLIRDLLDVGKVQAGKLQFHIESVELMSLLKELIAEIQLTTDLHKIKLAGPAEAWVQADRERLGQVVINLLENAIKYSPNATDIVVKVTAHPESIVVEVQDFGIGIQEKFQSELFNRFYRVTNDSSQTFSGLGLGLYISAEIIRHLGGRIWVTSTAGTGSTFAFELLRNSDSK